MNKKQQQKKRLALLDNKRTRTCYRQKRKNSRLESPYSCAMTHSALSLSLGRKQNIYKNIKIFIRGSSGYLLPSRAGYLSPDAGPFDASALQIFTLHSNKE